MNSRRLFLQSSARLVAGSTLASVVSAHVFAQASTASSTPAPRTPPPPKPPSLPLDKVQATVGESHRSLEKVRALVEETPLLANACWDLGGGDFETALLATAHTGRREIAEYLLSKGARLDLYVAGMLGMFGFVKAVLAQDPKAHEVPGPHGFTLLHCAKQGGATARPVYDFLIAQGVPEVFQRPLPYIWPAGTKPTA